MWPQQTERKVCGILDFSATYSSKICVSTVSKFHRWFEGSIPETQRISPHVLGRKTPLDDWRLPTPPQLTSLYVAIKHRQLLDRNPWRATHLLVLLNPGKVFNYIPHDFDKPDSESEFSVGLTDDYSLDNAITYSLERGLGSNQCWQHKSQNRAALSLLCTVDEGGHMVPGEHLLYSVPPTLCLHHITPVALYISANTKRETILCFLVGTNGKVVSRAEAIVADPDIISTRNRSPEIIATILENARAIVEHGWRMANIMMDKHWPSLLAVKDFMRLHNLELYIRICQFHVVFAIFKWEWQDGRKGLSVVIGIELKFRIIVLFRRVQRARTSEQFEQLKATFLVDLRRLIVGDEDEEDPPQTQKSQGKGKGGTQRGKPRTAAVKLNMYDAVCDYFQKKLHYTDIGMPANQSRDGTWNTNNFTESAFKTFDSVFLDNRQNKRIDRLAAVILNDFLPYYQYWRPKDRNPPKDIIEMHFNAYTLWDRGAVTVVRDNVDLRAYVFEVTMNPMNCICSDYQQSGKECVHIVAVQWLCSAGVVETWKTVEAESERSSTKLPSSKHKNRKVKSDAIEQDELYRILARLEREDEAEHQLRSTPEPSFKPTATGELTGFAAMGTQSGRPENSKPLHPGRSANPMFSRPPGRPPAGRLGANSLFPGTLKSILQRSSSARGGIDDGDLWDEEVDMTAGGVQRWVPDEYTLRIEDMGLFVTILNMCEIAQRNGWWFICSAPHCLTADIIEGLDWSVKISSAELRSKGMQFLADILDKRDNANLDHLLSISLILACRLPITLAIMLITIWDFNAVIPPFVDFGAVSEVQSHLRLIWFPDIYDGVPDGEPDEFNISLAAWAEGISEHHRPSDLVEIGWPSLLLRSPTSYPSPLYPTQAPLDNYLCSHLPAIIMTYANPTAPMLPPVFTALDARFCSWPQPQTFYRDLLGGAPGDEPFCAADEAHFSALSTEIQFPTAVTSALPKDPPQRSEVTADPLNWRRHWLYGAARAMLATVALPATTWM
ncbi:hypothetical protein C8R43DRAFT_957352 [Mycena crocata]|nr:hypothetical protein C8R43DRAFT_957352 [Mycena crocata]